MIRVLHVLAALNDGGVESMLKSYYENMNKDLIKFDFVVFEEEKGMLEDWFKQNGSKIYHILPKKKNFIKSNNMLKKIIKNGNYTIIHCHQNRSSIIPLYYAYKYNITKRICHSHTSNINESMFGKLVQKSCSHLLEKYSTDLFACSKAAGEWLYSKKNQEKVFILNNAFELEKFKYDQNIKHIIRDKYDLKDNIVIGCVARLHYHKNHMFLLEIFSKLLEENNIYKLFLVGDGTELNNIKNKAAKLNILDKIIFAGNCKNVNELLQAFDIFLLPTRFEGLGISLIESQVSGLLTITSKDVVPIETSVTPQIHYISLEKSASEWSKEINNLYKNNYTRKNYIDEISKKGFNINNEAKKLENKYLNMVKENG